MEHHPRSIIDGSRSIIDDSRSIIDDSRSLIDASRSIIDDSRSLIDESSEGLWHVYRTGITYENLQMMINDIALTTAPRRN